MALLHDVSGRCDDRCDVSYNMQTVIKTNSIHLEDNKKFLESYMTTGNNPNIDLIYIDPPFNTGKTQKLKDKSFNDSWLSIQEFLTFLRYRVTLCRDVLSSSGSFFFHIDPRMSHYCKIMLDEVFGVDSFMNEIIWAYDYGGRSKKKWSSKHDVIFWYVRDPKNYTFNFNEMDRIPYMAPGLVGKEKAARGKTPTDVWWHTIVPTNGKERLGYPTQKPLGVLERIVKVHSNPGEICMDIFAGSGTFGEAATKNGRKFILVDSNPDAVKIMQERLKKYE